ncbi:hypothetical protein EN854_34330, partial [Mesorhizobium sp. M4B.F.Ca.ET.211.01.1.1]
MSGNGRHHGLLDDNLDAIRVKGVGLAATGHRIHGLVARSRSASAGQDLAEIIRHRFTAPSETLRELFSRIVFNIL